MASFNKHNAFVENMAEKVHNLGSDTLKPLATNTARSRAGPERPDRRHMACSGAVNGDAWPIGPQFPAGT